MRKNKYTSKSLKRVLKSGDVFESRKSFLNLKVYLKLTQLFTSLKSFPFLKHFECALKSFLRVLTGGNLEISDSSAQPVAIIKVVRSIVHENETAEKAFEIYNSLKAETCLLNL